MGSGSQTLKNNVSGTLEIIGGSGSTITVAFDRGDFAWDTIKRTMNETVKIARRGVKRGALPGQRIWPKVGFGIDLPNLIGPDTSAPGTPLELLHGKGVYAAEQSTMGANYPIYTVNLRLTIDGESVGDSANEVITWHDVDATGAFTEGDDVNSLKIDGEVLGEIVVQNDTNTVTYDEYGA